MAEQFQPNPPHSFKRAVQENEPRMASYLEEIGHKIMSDDGGTALIAVHDTEPEKTAYLSLVEHTRAAEKVMLKREERFYHTCYGRLRLYDALIVDSRCARLPQELDERPEQYCLWPDACLAIFPGDRSLLDALRGAASLHRRLSENKAKNSLCWWLRLHIRVCIGSTFTAALACLPSAWRGEIAMPSDEIDLLPDDLVSFAMAAGLLRVGPAAADRAATAAQNHSKA